MDARRGSVGRVPRPAGGFGVALEVHFGEVGMFPASCKLNEGWKVRSRPACGVRHTLYLQGIDEAFLEKAELECGVRATGYCPGLQNVLGI